MIDPLSISTAFLIGLLGGVHCIGMCGGIVHSLSFAIADKGQLGYRSLLILGLYNSGRIISYTIIGAMLGSLAGLLQEQITMAVVLFRGLAGLMLIAMGLYLTAWWRGLVLLEKWGGYLWQFFQPLATRLIPVSNYRQALALGLIWGWLPCGLVYSTLALALAQGSWQQSAILMFSFGVGTLPVLFLTGALASRFKSWVQNIGVRSVVGICLIFFGLWTLITPLLPSGHQHHVSGPNLSLEPTHKHGTE